MQLARADGTEVSAADLEKYAFLAFSWGWELRTFTIISAIADIIRQADSHQGIPFGALTSENRDNWAYVRDSFSSIAER